MINLKGLGFIKIIYDGFKSFLFRASIFLFSETKIIRKRRN